MSIGTAWFSDFAYSLFEALYFICLIGWIKHLDSVEITDFYQQYLHDL